jgi:hypothetical protein
LRHVPPDARGLLNQVDFKPRSGEIKRSLNTADPSTDNHDISKITARVTFAKLFFHFSITSSVRFLKSDFIGFQTFPAFPKESGILRIGGQEALKGRYMKPALAGFISGCGLARDFPMERQPVTSPQFPKSPLR